MPYSALLRTPKISVIKIGYSFAENFEIFAIQDMRKFLHQSIIICVSCRITFTCIGSYKITSICICADVDLFDSRIGPSIASLKRLIWLDDWILTISLQTIVSCKM